MWRNIASNAVSFLIIVLFILGGVILWGKAQYTAQGPLDKAICVQVERGASLKQVSAQLAEKGAVQSESLFRVSADYTKSADRLKAGNYLVQDGASIQEIIETITRGGASTCGTEVVYRVGIKQMNVQIRTLDPETGRFVEKAAFRPENDPAPKLFAEVKSKSDTRFRVALAEGVTSWHVRNSLEQMDVLSGEISETPAEGSLAPDSYEIKEGDDRTKIIQRMQAQQQALLAQAWEARNPEIPVASPEELLILASLIEKETGVAEERALVASVFANRLKRGMKLQTDPAVIYGITKGQGVLGRGLRRSELRAKTPYNTYVIAALPPTPIANPGRASLFAAANPAETPFVFFVADGTGGHAFAETLEEHNANVAKWRAIEAERAGGN